MNQDLFLCILYLTEHYHIKDYEEEIINIFSDPLFNYSFLLSYFFRTFKTDKADLLFNEFYCKTASYIDK